jgi:DNA-binding CsgD family transcriptional regulator/PAS domain-containing protein
VAFAQLSNRIAESVGTRSAIFVELNAAGTADAMQLCYWNQDFIQFYAAHFATKDPWTALAINVGQFGRAAALDGYMTPEEFALTEMRNDCFRSFGDDTGRCLGVMPELGKPGLMVAVHKAERDAAFTDGEAARLDGVYSHLERVIKLRRMFERQRDRSARLQDLANQSDQALLQVDRNLRVQSLSASAQSLLELRDGIRLYRNRIVSTPAMEAQLKNAICSVIEKRDSVQNSMICPRPSGLRPYRIIALPAGFSGDAGAILKIDDPDAMVPVSTIEAIRNAYGLTTMEASLAQGLLAEQSVEEIAVGRAVGRETIKTHLKSLFNKTGVNRQSTLLKLLATFPKAGR